MSPLDHFRNLSATLPQNGGARFLMSRNSDAFIHAESLARMLDRAGLPSICQVEVDADCCTLVLCIKAPPPALTEALIEANLSFEVVDFKCNDEITQAYFEVHAFGSTIVVYTEVALVREDRAALLAPREKVAA